MKKISRNELASYLNELLRPSDYQDYCPNGIQVEGKEEVKKIAFAVSATKESINKAIEQGADTLIVHHGIFWADQGAKPITGTFANRVKPLIKNEINLFAYHLPLDGNLEIGNAAMLAGRLGLDNITPFCEYKKATIGVSGKLTKMVTAKQFKELIKEAVHHEVTASMPNPNQIINSVAIVTGGAGRFFKEAQGLGVDAYITGEISEYQWNDAQEGTTHLFAAGHTATEALGVQALLKRIENQFGIDCIFIPSENPV